MGDGKIQYKGPTAHREHPLSGPFTYKAPCCLTNLSKPHRTGASLKYVNQIKMALRRLGLEIKKEIELFVSNEVII